MNSDSCVCGDTIYTCELCSAPASEYTLQKNEYHYSRFGDFLNDLVYSDTLFPSCPPVAFPIKKSDSEEYLPLLDVIGVPSTIYRTYGEISYDNPSLLFGLDFSELPLSDYGAIKFGDYSGENSETFTPVPFEGNLQGFAPLFGDGGVKFNNSPGFILYGDHKQGVWNGEEYYYHNYVYKVGNSVRLRSFPQQTGITPPSLRPGWSGSGFTYGSGYATFGLYWSGSDACPFCDTGDGTYINYDWYSWDRYGGWSNASCEQDRFDAYCGLPLGAYCIFKGGIIYCVAQLVESYVSKTINSRYGSSEYMFVQDQDVVDFDLRDLPQRFTESTPSIPTVNSRLNGDNIEVLDYVYPKSDWGN